MALVICSLCEVDELMYTSHEGRAHLELAVFVLEREERWIDLVLLEVRGEQIFLVGLPIVDIEVPNVGRLYEGRELVLVGKMNLPFSASGVWKREEGIRKALNGPDEVWIREQLATRGISCEPGHDLINCHVGMR